MVFTSEGWFQGVSWERRYLKRSIPALSYDRKSYRIVLKDYVKAPQAPPPNVFGRDCLRSSQFAPLQQSNRPNSSCCSMPRRKVQLVACAHVAHFVEFLEYHLQR
eukprot:2263583-Amphidinium_carterae.1